MKIQLKDFETHSEVEIDIAGITVIEGENYVGKSTLIRAFEAALKNEVPLVKGKDVPKWNRDFDSKNPFQVQIEDGNTVLNFSRGRYVLNGATKDTGKDKLYKVFPEFPYKVVDFGDSTYYNPHVVSQGETPVFSTLDVYTFFSSLFDKISAIGDSMDESKKRIRDLKKSYSDSEAVLSSNKAEFLIHEKNLSEYDVKRLENLESLLLRRNLLRDELESLKREKESLQGDVSQYSRYVLLARTELNEMGNTGKAIERHISLLKQQKTGRSKLETLVKMRELRKIGDSCISHVEIAYSRNTSGSAISDLSIQYKELKREIDSVDSCPICGQHIDSNVSELLGV